MRRRAVLVLTTLALALAASSGAATAETQNGPIYYPYGSMQYAALFSVDPPPAYPQPVQKTESGVNVQTYDISQDRKTLIYEQGCPGLCSSWSGMLWTLSRDEPNGAFFNGPEVMGVSNRWQCDRGSDDPDLNCSGQAMTQPTFSPDGETVYFVGQRLLSPDDPPGIYSVPTEGGEATRVPIEQGDGTPVVIDGLDGFDLSHHGSKLAFGGDHGIFTVPAGGGIPTRVTDEGYRGVSSPSFSPDDRRIVYSSVIWSGDDCTGTGHRTVYAAPADGDGTSPGDALFPEDATDAVPGYTLAKYDPIYSPDGEQIAFVSWQDGFDHLAVAPATGGSITNVVRCVFRSPLWLEKPPPDTSITSGPRRPRAAPPPPWSSLPTRAASPSSAASTTRPSRTATRPRHTPAWPRDLMPSR